MSLTIEVGISLTSILASITNLGTFHYIKKTYDTTKSLYFIFALDSAFAGIGSFVTSLAFWSKIYGFVGLINCSLITLSSMMFGIMQTNLIFIVSLIRWKRLSKLDSTWNEDPVYIKRGAIFFTMYFIGLIGFVLINSLFDLDMLPIFNVCIGKSYEAKNEMFAWAVVIIPMVILSVATAIMDLSCWLFVTKNSNTNLDRDMPLRVSMISFVLMVIIMIFPSIILGLVADTSSETKFFFVHIFSCLMTLVRDPLIAFVGFRVNEVNRQVDQEADREMRRQKEIQDSWRAKNKRIVNEMPPVEI